ncbi:MAG: chorismate mutase [Actinomycetota bacterium]|nr:chorismate mutase [Actinomycetota bacterium]
MTTAVNNTASDLPVTDSTAVEAAGIPTLRDQIDALDAAIVSLVAERARLSQRIQTARMNAGGARVELGRERVILDTYRGALGSQGPHLADAVLQVCRGER